MLESVDARMLLSVPGVALVTLLLIQLLVKPALKLRYEIDDEADKDHPNYKVYSFYNNLAALAVALVFSEAAAFIFRTPDTDVGEVVLIGLATAILAAASATGIYEFADNGADALRSP